MNNNYTIAFYDSGIGGITLLSKAVKLLKGCNIIYFGDNLNAPYGNKSKPELIDIAVNNVTKLSNLGANVICLACNTLSTQVLNDLKLNNQIKNLNVSLTGVFPPKPHYGKNSVLLCTQATANSEYVKTNFKNSTVLPLPFLAKEIERFYFDKDKIIYVADLKGITNSVTEIILGCTHYGFIKNEISKIFKTALITDGISTAILNVKRALISKKHNDFNVTKVTCNHLFENPPKIIKTDKNTIYFVGECANYNKKVFLNYTY